MIQGLVYANGTPVQAGDITEIGFSDVRVEIVSARRYVLNNRGVVLRITVKYVGSDATAILPAGALNIKEV